MNKRKDATARAGEIPAGTEAADERRVEDGDEVRPEDGAQGDSRRGEGSGGGGAEAATGADEPSPAPQETPEEKLRALRKERDAVYERWLRAAADLENFRKRIDREREEFRRTSLESIAAEMVQVLDNFDRAMSALPPGAPPALVEGVRLIHKQILDVMARRGLVPMEKAEGSFDPHLHEAVATEVREDVAHHHVLEEVQRGYVLQGRVLRPALVKVSVRPGEEDSRAEKVP